MNDKLNELHRLAEQGYRVFPCATGAKNPLTPRGLHDATTDAEQIERWHTQWPLANWALSTDGLWVVDVDGADNLWPHDAERSLDLAAAVVQRTPRGGRHFIFRAPEGKPCRNTAGKQAPNVDERGDGGYILIAPSVVDGNAYHWPNGPLDVRRERLPVAPAWVVERHESQSASATRVDVVESGGAIVEGGRNQTLTSLAGALRRISLSPDAIAAALKLENAARCRPPLADSEVETIANSVGRYAPDELATAQAEGRLPDAFAPYVGPADPGELPESLLYVPGFINDVMEYNHDGANKWQPVLALAGALSLLATLTGRKITDEFGTRTNFYAIGTGETGIGKERARQVNKDILMAAGLDKMIGPESFASSSGIVTSVEIEPSILFQIDEIGRYLRAIGDSKESHLTGIITVLLKMFSSSGSIYVGDARADMKNNKKIYQPHACVYGTTVPKSLFEGLTSESLTDGFLSRTLIFEAPEVERQRPSKRPPPQGIIDTARWWGAFRHGGNLASVNPEPLIVPSSEDANMLIEQLEALADAEAKHLGDPLGPLWTRASEKARKLALLWACSSIERPIAVRLDAAAWASALVSHLTRRMIFIADKWIAPSPYDAKLKRVLRIIDGAGPNGASLTTINNNTGLPSRERGEILDDLRRRGQAFMVAGITGGGPGRPGTRYISSRFADAAASN